VSRSGLAEAWLDSHAHAAVTLWRHGRVVVDVPYLFGRICGVAESLAGPGATDDQVRGTVITVMADVAAAVFRLIDPAAHPDLGVQFTDLDTGEAEVPDIFLTSADGRASVWAARAAVAAGNGRADDLEALLEALASLPPTGDGASEALLYANRALSSTGPLVAMQVDGENLHALERTMDGFELPLYAWVCSCGRSEAVGDLDLRNLTAAGHILDNPHELTLETRWT